VTAPTHAYINTRHDTHTDEGVNEYDLNDPFVAPEGEPSVHSSLNDGLDNLNLDEGDEFEGDEFEGDAVPVAPAVPQPVLTAWNKVRATLADIFPGDCAVLDAFFRQQ